ncbi:uncharacterized protein METZ01_LOCUS300831 [marine metagenome]|uniref:Uncharacterized protein n=1 Tax=marine metagenome TaxID=408172 RepID=A0A382MJQ3_9ZZZZ
MINISLLGTVQQISHNLGKYPPCIPVKPIQTAPFLLANLSALTTFSDFPLPLNAITTSPFETKFFNCSTNISSYEASFAHAKMTGRLSTHDMALNRLFFFVIEVFSKSDTK